MGRRASKTDKLLVQFFGILLLLGLVMQGLVILYEFMIQPEILYPTITVVAIWAAWKVKRIVDLNKRIAKVDVSDNANEY